MEFAMLRILFPVLAIAAMVPVAGSALAQEDAATPAAAPLTPKVGQVVRDAKGRRLAAIESIRGDSVYVIMDMRMYRIPTSTLSMGEKGLQTSLNRSDIN
jgi:hypothetical protein